MRATIHDFQIGERAIVQRAFTEADVETFAALSGDRNPLHVDPIVAGNSRFGERIVHGALTASLISRLIGMDLPGQGAIYMRQETRFTAPVHLNEEIEASVEIIAIDLDRSRLTLSTTCRSLISGTIVLEGQALVKFEAPRS